MLQINPQFGEGYYEDAALRIRNDENDAGNVDEVGNNT